jgi:hypothetical protein
MLSDETLNALHRCAQEHKTTASQFVKDYVEYLLAGGQPIGVGFDQGPTNEELARLAQVGKSFDWLADEPELYTPADGEPV